MIDEQIPVFARSSHRPYGPWRQPDLAATLTLIRTVGVGDMYQGGLARRIEQASAQIGGPIRFEDLREALPKLAAPLIRDFRKDKV